MPMPIVPKAVYPLVPFAPGVPALLRNGAKIIDTLTFNTLGIGDALDSVIGSGKPQWGIFTSSGDPVALAESVVSMEFENTMRVSNYPIEGGKFSSYNKVNDPYSITLRMTCGLGEEERAAFIFSVESASKSLELYTVVTPETTYLDANIVAVGYRRDSENGANKITYDIRITEVREVAASAFASPKEDTSARDTSLGQIQTVDDISFDTSEFA